MFASKLNVMAVLMLAAGVVAAGAALLAQQTVVVNQADAKKEVRAKAAATGAEPPNLAPAKQIRTDRYGDPLPPGAVARLGTLRFRTPGEAQALAFAPDGKTIAISSYGGLFLFDAGSGKRIRRLATSDSAWRLDDSLVFSADGKRLAGRATDIVADRKGSQRPKGVVRVWELAGKQKPREYDAEHVIWLGWSADGEPLAVCLETGGLRLHELAARRSKRFDCQGLRKPELSDYVVCACAPAARALAVADQQNVIHVWDTANGRERCTVPTKKNDYIRRLALSPDGRILASLNREAVQLWDATTGTPQRTVVADTKYLAAVAFAADSKTLATAGSKGVWFWDVATGRERSGSQGEGSNTEWIAFSADAQTLATLERNCGAFHLWDVSTGKRRPEPVGHRSGPHGTAFSPDGRRVATGGGLDGTIHVWDLANGKSLLHIRRPGQWVRDIAWSADGRSLYSTWIDDNLWISDAASGERQHIIKLDDPERPDTHQSAISMYLSDDGKTLVAFSYYGGPYEETLITGWDPTTRKNLFRRRRAGRESSSAVSPNARLLAMPNPSSGEKETAPGQPMRLEGLATGEPLLTFPVLEGQTWPLAFSTDGRLLASNNSNYKLYKKGDPTSTGASLHLWETATALEVLSLPLAGHRVAFSPNGRLLAMTAPWQDILVWDLARGGELRRFKGFGAGVTWLAFAPDGRRLISGLADSTLLVWDVGPQSLPATGKLGAEEAAKLWSDLGSRDAARAFWARWALVTAPETAVPLLKARLTPARPADVQQLRRFLADLDSDRFAIRKKAQQGLEEMGEMAAPALRQALAQKPALEVRRRIEALLDKLRGPVTRPETLRALRALAVLEDVATAEARKLLEVLAQGAPEARLTQEARAALQRLARRPGSSSS